MKKNILIKETFKNSSKILLIAKMLLENQNFLRKKIIYVLRILIIRNHGLKKSYNITNYRIKTVPIDIIKFDLQSCNIQNSIQHIFIPLFHFLN